MYQTKKNKNKINNKKKIKRNDGKRNRKIQENH